MNNSFISIRCSISLVLIFMHYSAIGSSYADANIFSKKCHKQINASNSLSQENIALQKIILEDLLVLPQVIGNLILDYLQVDCWKESTTWSTTDIPHHIIFSGPAHTKSPHNCITAIYAQYMVSYFYDNALLCSINMPTNPHIYHRNTIIPANDATYIAMGKNHSIQYHTFELDIYNVNTENREYTQKPKECSIVCSYTSVKQFITSGSSCVGILTKYSSQQPVIRIFNARAPKQQNTIPTNLCVSAMAFSPDGKLLIISDKKGHAEIWPTDLCVYTPNGHKKKLTIVPHPQELALSNSSKIVAVVSNSDALESGLYLFPNDRDGYYKDDTVDICSPVFSHDESLLVNYNSGAGRIEVRNGSDGAVMHYIRPHNNNTLLSVIFAISPTTNHIVTSDMRGGMTIWENRLTEKYDIGA